MTPEQQQAAAATLFEAERTGRQIGLLSRAYPGVTLDDAYAVQAALVRRLAAYGQGLSAGEVVLSGSFIRPVEAPPGSRFAADFGDFGSVGMDFAQG